MRMTQMSSLFGQIFDTGKNLTLIPKFRALFSHNNVALYCAL